RSVRLGVPGRSGAPGRTLRSRGPIFRQSSGRALCGTIPGAKPAARQRSDGVRESSVRVRRLVIPADLRPLFGPRIEDLYDLRTVCVSSDPLLAINDPSAVVIVQSLEPSLDVA